MLIILNWDWDFPIVLLSRIEHQKQAIKYHDITCRLSFIIGPGTEAPAPAKNDGPGLAVSQCFIVSEPGDGVAIIKV